MRTLLYCCTQQDNHVMLPALQCLACHSDASGASRDLCWVWHDAVFEGCVPCLAVECRVVFGKMGILAARLAWQAPVSMLDHTHVTKLQGTHNPPFAIPASLWSNSACLGAQLFLATNVMNHTPVRPLHTATLRCSWPCTAVAAMVRRCCGSVSVQGRRPGRLPMPCHVVLIS